MDEFGMGAAESSAYAPWQTVGRVGNAGRVVERSRCGGAVMHSEFRIRYGGLIDNLQRSVERSG